MNSTWVRQLGASLRKEAAGELRSAHGLFTGGLFGLMSVAAISFASVGDRPSPNQAAGMLCVALLFSAVVALPRTFLVEEDQGTLPLALLLADPRVIFAGKALWSLVQLLVGGAVLGTLFVGLTGVEVNHPWLLPPSIAALCWALAAGISLCGALTYGASNRWTLVAVIGVPLLLPVIALGIGAFRVAFGFGAVEGAMRNLIALAGYAAMLSVLGLLLAQAVWRLEPGRAE